MRRSTPKSTNENWATQENFKTPIQGWKFCVLDKIFLFLPISDLCIKVILQSWLIALLENSAYRKIRKDEPLFCASKRHFCDENLFKMSTDDTFGHLIGIRQSFLHTHNETIVEHLMRTLNIPQVWREYI